MENIQPTALPISCHIKVDGAVREIFMSFALLNRLAYLVGSPDNVALILVNPEMREAALRELLAERSPKGKLVKYLEMDEYEISLMDVRTVLDFATVHVLDFTLGVVEQSQLLQANNQARLNKLTLMSTQPGPENKPS